MPRRTREMLTHRNSGEMQTNGVWAGGPDAKCIASRRYVDDWVLPSDNEPFYQETYETTGGEINQPYTGKFNSYFLNYVADAFRGTDFFKHVGTGAMSNSQAAIAGMARTNPSRPYVDLPVNLFELSDITQLIRDSGRSLLKKAAGANLKYNFGILPLAGDIAKLMDFQKALDFRGQEVKRLFSGNGLRRTVTVSKTSGMYSNVVQVQSFGKAIYMAFDGQTQETVRVHCRWKPTEEVPSDVMGNERLRYLTRTALLGLKLDASTAWELLPWSWMADWGGNVGQYFAAKRNVLPAVIDEISVIRHRKTVAVGKRNADSNWTINGAKNIRETKQRERVTSVAPSAHIPVLTGTQTGILASLAVTRSGGR